MTQFSRRLEHLITNMHFFLVFPCLSKSPLYLGPSKSAVFFFSQNMKLALSTGRKIIANRQQLQFSWSCKGSVCQRMESNCSNGWRPKQIQVLEFWTMTWLWGFPLLTDTYWYYYTLFHCFIVQIGNQLSTLDVQFLDAPMDTFEIAQLFQRSLPKMFLFLYMSICWQIHCRLLG